MSSTKEILILSANPQNTARLRLDEEVREIGEGLKRSKNRDQFIIHQRWAVRLRDLRRAILDCEPQIVHFCGHGEADGLMIEDEGGNAVVVTPDAIAGLFELFKDKVICVLLNSCYSESQAVAINAHIPYVIGMTQSIPDKAALEFAIGFYDALGAGKSIEEAFKFGRNAIQLYNIPNHLTPVLKKKSKSVLEVIGEKGKITSELAIEHMLMFAKNHAQPGNWTGLDRLQAEVGNLVWAARKAYERKQWDKVIEFRRTLGDFLYWRGFWDEALQVGEWSFDAADRLGDHKERAWCALYPLARVYFHQGDYDAAQTWSERSLALFRQQGDDYGIAAACRYLGRTLQAKGNLDKAQALFVEGFNKARQFASTDSHKNMQGHLLAALAGVHYERGQYEEAQGRYEEALALYHETQNQTGIAAMLHRIGNIASQCGRYGEADRVLQESLKAVESIHSEQMEAEILYSLALLAEKQDDLELAQERLEQACERFRSLSAQDSLARAERTLNRISGTLDHRQKR